MLRFFHQLRQRLLTEKQFRKYLVYVVVEIFIVIMGILIAIQIDSWNEERINRERYEFGIKQLYRRLKARDLTWDLYRERATFHLSVIDSLMNHPDLIPPKRLMGNLLVLDEFLNDDWIDEEWFLNYLDFNPTDSIQFEVAQNLHRYFYGRYPNFRNWVELKDYPTFKSILINENLPFCEFTMGQSFSMNIDLCAGIPRDEETFIRLYSLLKSERIQSKLQILKSNRQEFLNLIHTPEGTILAFMEENFDHLDDPIESIEIAGDGNPDWVRFEGLPMQPVNTDRTIWKTETTFVAGWIKFRTDEGWTFEWGRGEFNPEKLVFKGAQIPVSEGRYQVVLNLKEKTYDLIPIQ